MINQQTLMAPLKKKKKVKKYLNLIGNTFYKKKKKNGNA